MILIEQLYTILYILGPYNLTREQKKIFKEKGITSVFMEKITWGGPKMTNMCVFCILHKAFNNVFYIFPQNSQY